MNGYTEKNRIFVFTFQPKMVILESIFKFKLTRRKANEKLIDKNTFYLNLTTLNILAIINMSILF